jgi:hypothetical protein
VQSRFLLDVVIRQGSAVLQLFARKDQALLVWRNALLVLDLLFHIVDRVRGLHIQSDGLASQSLHEDLHPASQSQHQVQSRFLLDVVIRQGSAVLQLFARKDQALLVWRNTLLVLDLLFHIVDRVRGLHIQSDGLASQSLHEDLHRLLFSKFVTFLLFFWKF